MPTRDEPAAELPDRVRTLLQERVDENLELPIQSATAAEVMAACTEKDVDARRLSAAVERDPGLTGRMLAAANSAAHGTKEKIVSLHQAVSRLGIVSVRGIALAESLKSRVFEVPGFAVANRELWLHSAVAGVYAKEIAGLLRRDIDGIFVCGLLHDIGKPIVMQNFVDLASERASKPVPRTLMNLAMDTFHEAVGARMIEHWELPAWMAAVVGSHHDYAAVDPEWRLEGGIVHLASLLSHWALGEEEELLDEDPVFADLGLDDSGRAKLAGMRDRVLEITESFV